MTVMLSPIVLANINQRAEVDAISLADIDLFTIYGKVEVTLLIGEVIGVGDGGATTIRINDKTHSLPWCAATTVDGDAVGEIYVLTGDTTLILGGTGAVPVLHLAGFLSAFPHNSLIVDGEAGLVIELTVTGADATHAVRWTMFYKALEAGAYVEAA